MLSLRSIRTWLAGTLAGVSLLTAGTIALYVVPSADRQFRSLAQDAALGLTARAAHDAGAATSLAGVRQALARASRDGQLSLWLVDGSGRLIAQSALPSVHRASLPDAQRAVAIALSGRRFVPTGAATGSHVIALPAHTPSGARAALVAYAPRAALAARTSDALRRNLVFGTLLAVALALVVSFGVASLVTRRVRRLARAAGAIAAGDFRGTVRDSFPDEIGLLAGSIDEMRERLAAAFAVLERERGGLSSVVERLEEGVIALDPTGVVEIVNPAAGELLGVAIAPGHQLPFPWPAAALARRIGGSGSPARDVETPRGRWLHVQHASLRPDDDNGPSLIVVSDRTAERDREAAERRFVANASHELRTPLSAIVAAVEILQSGAKDDIGVRDAFLEDVHHEAKRLQRLTGVLLTLAQIGSVSLEPSRGPVPLLPRLEHVAEVMQPLAEAARVAIDVVGDATALADPDILDQVLLGLVGNALKHTPPGGEIRLSASELSTGLRVTVADTGSGIPRDQLPHVFDRFWRGDGARQAGGFGLGLGICREYVEAMDGTISIQSRPGAGTTVEILLPHVNVTALVEVGT